MNQSDYLQRQHHFLRDSGAGLFCRAIEAVRNNRNNYPWGCFFAEDLSFPPAFLPGFLNESSAFGAWIEDPGQPKLCLVEIFIELPNLAAQPHGRSGLRLIMDMLEIANRTSKRRLIDALFLSEPQDNRDRLFAAACEQYLDSDDRELVRTLPILGDYWKEEDWTDDYRDPIPALVARTRLSPELELDLAQAPDRRDEFDMALCAGDTARAWALLNDSHWSFEDSSRAFERIATSIDASVRDLVAAKMDPGVFGPLNGY
ncbi:MAG: hypothetical protein ACOZQL_18305 [Myxococcota bacterium]